MPLGTLSCFKIMPALAVKKNSWDGATDTQRYVFRIMGIYSLIRRDLRLGTPATYEQPGGTQWYIFDHPWWEERHLCYLFNVFANIADWPDGITATTEANDRERIMQWCEAGQTVPLKLPGALDPTPDGADPWTDLATQCGAPSFIAMATSIPANWTPVGDE